MRTHYQNLKVDEKAPLSVIKAAYKALALEYHPDRRKADPEAERIFKIIQESYNVLCDPDKRRAHDEWIKSSRGKNGGGHKSRHSTKPARSYRPSNPAPFAFLVFTLIAAGLFWQFGQSELLYEVLDRYLVRKALPDQSIEEDISQSSDQVAQLIEPPRPESAVGVENAAITANEPVQISEDAVAQSDPVEESQIDLSANSEPTYETTREALLDFYEKANGDAWVNNEGWGGENFCVWYGVTCEGVAVVELELSNNNLTGVISPKIGQLTSLRRLVLVQTDKNTRGLEGAIPPELGLLVNLEELDLMTNSLSGNIPDLSALVKLTRLALLNNFNLTGPIPIWLDSLTELRVLSLSANRLDGSIPRELGNLTKLEYLGLSQNRLSGSIPNEIGRLTNLYLLGLSANNLEGPIPASFADLVNLERLFLGNNSLSGEVPDFIYQRNFEALTLDGNNFSSMESAANSEPTYETTREVLLDLYEKAGGDNWSDNTYWTDGGYCSWYGITCDEGPVGRANPQVVEINLSSNNLSGTITQRIGELSHLRRLQISFNDLWGTIPESIGNLKNLEVLALSENALSGLLPLELSKLEKLRHLRIFQNQLVGEFFPAINGLTNLESIYAAANNLSGEIPPEISRLNNLEVLSLGRNRISGELPRELGFLVRLEYLGLQFNQLRGEIPQELSQIPVLQRLYLQGNGLTGDIPTGLISPELRLDVSENRLNPGQPIRFDNLNEDDWSMTIRGTAMVSTDGLYLVVNFPKLLVRNPDSEVKQLRGLVAVVFEEGNYENTFQDSQWLASWVPIEPDQTRSLTEVEFLIPFGNIATSSMNNYRLGIKVYSTDSKEVDRRPPSSSEGWAWVRGSEKIVKEYVTEL